MKVPSDPDAPSWAQTYSVGFWAWLTSSGAERREWRVRRDMANRLRHDQQMTAIREKYGPASEQLRAEMARVRREIVAQLAKRRR